ncbi:MAG: redoxin family protein [Pseudohongiellaceae bacterium]
MKIFLSCLILATIPIFTTTAVHGAERVGDFALLDQHGEHHSMRWYNDKKSVALLVHGLSSEATLSALPAYINLKQQYTEQGVQFFLINPMGRLNREAVQQEIATYTNDIPVLMDDSQKISEALGITQTGEVLLFNPTEFTVNFRGSVGPELEAALQAVISGEKVVASEVTVSGDSVQYPAEHSVSYEQDIAPILAANCAECHRAGGIGPFALDSYTMALGWSPMIREVLMTRRMPPGQIDPHIHKFSNDRNLAIADLQKLLSWIDAGSPRDGTTDPLAELDWPDTEWTVPLGPPDLVVEVPPQTIPATGVLDWQDITVPVVGMEKDRWVKASEFIPGDTTVVHHSTVSLTPEGIRDPDVAVLTRYVPGQDPRIELPNTGGLMRKDSTLYVTMHYTTSGKETVDRSKYGIWFYPEDTVPEERMQSRMVGLFGSALPDIPPHEKNFEVSSSFTLREDVNALAYHPHMHFRGVDLRMFADYPDGSREELINIPYYSYLWQLTYNLTEPKLLPAGTTVTAVGHFDNSSQNPFNPDPSATVVYGEQSWDEMFFGEIVYKTANQ